MSALLKDFYSPQLIQRIADTLQNYYPKLKHQHFIDSVLDKHWPQLELKQRQYQLSACLFQSIPENYPTVLLLLCKVASEFSSSQQPNATATKEQLGNFEFMFFPGVIEHFGYDKDQYWQENMQALSLFTQYSSSEFAVRPFIIKHPEKMMAQMQAWTQHENYHVRRLASEGCRPSLPWALALKDFQKSPQAIIPILDALKNDTSLYVRRSVANNLNDISKNQENLVLMLATQWLGKAPETDWLVKHGLRTLLKQGNVEALALFGYHAPVNISCSEITANTIIALGETLTFSAKLSSSSTQIGKCRLEFAIDFVKKNQSIRQKVFKISEGNIDTANKCIEKSFSFKALSTRCYYPGEHQLHIIVNGHKVQSKKFSLVDKK